MLYHESLSFNFASIDAECMPSHAGTSKSTGDGRDFGNLATCIVLCSVITMPPIEYSHFDQTEFIIRTDQSVQLDHPPTSYLDRSVQVIGNRQSLNIPR